MQYYDDFYSFVIYKLELQEDITRADRDPRNIVGPLFGPKTNGRLKKLREEYDQLHMDKWEEFQIWTDMRSGLMHTPEDMGKELGLSPATVRKRLGEFGIPKYNGNEDNPFGKRFIPDCIYGRLKEILEDWKHTKPQ